ncbi:hypothetical protein [Mycolicibacterium litorale]|uniref:Uncharacterized protein n=1 Tax=Mycolicibacterium litorale TaxID=758802 RepID=A0AAD1IMT4_9MYCO|nr:hypothetical protein [Mycolicibacterium litorale]MCV7416598.1 hypothetical protein [Mycolicibacterium litorale]TDY09850.1 hypothetical protein BCL50_1955 [Mycolicibacterium litorale]BBY17811.1 hypothetical protein MLIT_34030 [Mycolicibacterium litorale]
MRLLRRILEWEVSVGAVLQTLVWSALPYIIVGVVVVGLIADVCMY